MTLLDKLREVENCKFFPPDRALALAKKLISEDRVRGPHNPNDYVSLMAKLFGLTILDRVGRWLVTGTDSEFDAKWLARVEFIQASWKYSLTEDELMVMIQSCNEPLNMDSFVRMVSW